MGTRIIKTAGQVAYEDYRAAADIPFTWEQTAKAAWEAFATKHNIQPLTEEVADKPTDGELLRQVFVANDGWDAIAAKFLRLRAERDGEPLPVTEKLLSQWNCDEAPTGLAYLPWLAAKINQHRGVRPVPQVTAEMLEQVLRRETLGGAAESLNAELAKSAVTATAVPDDERSTRLARLCLDLRDAVNKYHHDRLQSSLDEVNRLAGFCNTPAMLKDAYPLPMKVAAYATLKDHLHTFEDVEDMKAFTRANNFSQAGYIDGHEHHPRKA